MRRPFWNWSDIAADFVRGIALGDGPGAIVGKCSRRDGPGENAGAPDGIDGVERGGVVERVLRGVRPLVGVGEIELRPPGPLVPDLRPDRGVETRAVFMVRGDPAGEPRTGLADVPVVLMPGRLALVFDRPIGRPAPYFAMPLS